MTNTTDPVTAEIIHNRLMQIAHEGGTVLQRCAVSPAIVESKDMGFNMADKHGRTVIYSTWMPRHGTTLSYMLESCKQEFADDIRPGDMYMVNDPHAGALHSLDIAVIAPVFVDDELVAWVGNATHHLDIGAMSTGRAPLATDWFQEGMIFRPIRLVEHGRIRQDVFNLFLDNVRVPRAQSLDLKAQISANSTAIDKIATLVRRYGSEAFQRTCDESIEMAEQIARERIGTLREGTYEWTEFLDYDRTYELKGTLVVKGGTLRFDLTGTDPQSTTFINAAMPCSVANIHNIVACQLFPDVSVNAGTFRAVDVEIPPGTVLSCEAPAPCSGASTITGWKAQQLALGLLSQALIGSPEWTRAQAQWGWGFVDVQWTGKDATGHWYVAGGDPTMHGGGARASVDGIDVSNIAGSTNTAIPSVESYEQRYPVLYLARGIVEDSAGEGQYRGGVAGYWARTLYGASEASDNTFYIGRFFGASGIEGGTDGASSLIRIKRGSDIFRRLPSSLPSYEDLAGDEETLTQKPEGLGRIVSEGDVVHVRGMGGGGFGPPEARAPELLREDLVNGFISLARAREVYGTAAVDAALGTPVGAAS